MGLGILDDLLAVCFVAGLEGFSEGHRLSGNDVLQGSALHAWEDTAVEQRAEVADSALHCGQSPRVGEVVANHDDAAAWAPKGLVRGGGHHVTVRKWVVKQASRNQAGGMRNVGEQDGPDLVCDGAEARVVPLAGVGGGATNDHLGLLPLGRGFHLVHVDATSVLFHPVEGGTV